MIKELCLLDLLKEEKDAVEKYNITMSSLDEIIKLCYNSAKENPNNSDFIKNFRDKQVSKYEAEKKEAEAEIKEVREKIRQYFSEL